MKTKFLILLLIGIIVISGCVQEENSIKNPTGQVTKTSEPTTTTHTTTDSTTPQQTISETDLRSSKAQFIGNFVAIGDDDKIEARFSLLDGSKKYVSGDGIGKIRIVNSDGETVYTGTIDVKKEDFGTYTLLLTGENFLAYVWEIPLTEIKKSTSSSGTMYLTFKVKDYIFEELDTSIIFGLPTYTEEELAQLNEEEFSKTAIIVNKKLTKGSFEVTVKRVGLFTPLVLWGEKEEYFMVDMDIKNIGSEKDYFSPSGLAILDNNGNQYEIEYGGSLDTFSQIYPGVKKSGYLLFEKIPKTSQNIKLVFDVGYDDFFDPYSFEYNIQLSK